MCSNTKNIILFNSILNELAERDLFMYVKLKPSLDLIEVIKKVEVTILLKTFFLLLISDSRD